MLSESGLVQHSYEIETMRFSQIYRNLNLWLMRRITVRVAICPENPGIPGNVLKNSPFSAEGPGKVLEFSN